MQSFEFLDLILFFGISQGVFLAITIQIIKNKNRPANKVLSIILIMAVLMLLGRMIFFKYLTVRLFQFTILIDTVIFLFGPLCTIYFRRLLFSQQTRFQLPLYHYIPAVVQVIFATYILILTTTQFEEQYALGYFTIPFIIVEGLGLLSNIYYWILNVGLLNRYSKEQKNKVSFQQNLVSFLKFFQIAIGVFILFWIVSFISINFFNYAVKFINYNTVWGSISIFIFIIGYYSLKEPELFRISFEKIKVKPQKRLPEDQIENLKRDLKYVMENEKLFLKPDLTLRYLSERLDTSTHNISWYLNTVLDSNFYDYINRYRVQEFLKKIENREHLDHTILAISIEVGFNSKSTFNKAFKLEMNDTPSNYIKQIQVLS